MIELGFIDSTFYNEVFSKRKDRIVRAISKAIVESLGRKYKDEDGVEENKKQEKYYRVVTGSFKDINNARLRVKSLKDAGYESMIVPFILKK